MACECVRCPDCGGSGHYYSFMGKYVGQHRCDDMDEQEQCETCGGSGCTETCYECMDGQEVED